MRVATPAGALSRSLSIMKRTKATRWGLLSLLALLCALTLASAKAAAPYGPPPEEWAQRSILQVLTDRFSLPYCPSKPRRCKDRNNACGGTHVGLRQRLDYIQNMGFDAIWISPVTSQTGGPVFQHQDGWHGYWPKNLWDLNSILGTAADLKSLTNAVHKRGMWVMLDIVPNHAGYFKPERLHEMTFDKMEYYHGCSACLPGTCRAPPNETLQQTIECKLIGLPDLNQSHPHVQDTLLHWVDWMRNSFHIDGFRVDAAKHMYPEFLRKLKDRAGVFTIGENFYAEWDKGTRRIAEMLNDDQLYSALNFGLAFSAQYTFFGDGHWPEEGPKPYVMYNTTMLKLTLDMMFETMPDHVHLLGNFLDNHDLTRALGHDNTDETMLMNALAFTFMVPGIPIVFYGTEAGLEKANQPLWEDWEWDEAAPLYLKIKMLNEYRRNLQLWTHGYKSILADGKVFVFARGDAALTVVSGQDAKLNFDQLPRKITLQDLPASWRGKTLFNIFNPNFTLDVSADGTAELVLCSLDPLVFVQHALHPDAFLPTPPAKWLLPINYVVLMLTVISMLVVVFALKWASHPRRLHAWSTAWSNMRSKRSKEGSTDNCHAAGGSMLDAAASKSAKADAADAADQDDDCIPVGECTDKLGDGSSSSSGGGSSGKLNPALNAEAKQKQHLLAQLTGGSSMRKDDSASDLQKLPALRSMAALDGCDKPNDLLISAGRPDASSTATAIKRLDPQTIMHVAMEYSIPHLGLHKEFMYGGLGMVVDLFAKFWPADMVLCAPLYAQCYNDPSATQPKFATGGPVMRFEVPVGHQVHQVDVFEVDVADQPPCGVNRRYLLLQADVFRHRMRGDIYSFSSEHEMIAWLSVWNQAVAHVIQHWGVAKVQLHDYHGALSLQYLAPEHKPQVLYVAHNAHYNGVFALPTKQRRAYLYDMFNLNPAAVSKYTEHKSAFDALHSLLTHMREAQSGIGCAAVSPNYAAEIRTRLSPFWQIKSGNVIGIMNAMDPSGTWAGAGLPADEVLRRKTAAKLQLQQRFGMAVGEQYSMAIFMGRLTHQKGVDVIAEAAPQVLARHPKLQLLVIGPLGDVAGAEAQAALGQLALQYPDRLVAPANHYVDGEEKQLILAAADFCLCPSRYEPCGLVDIEFGWFGSLIIGHETGGLGKMPGFYFKSAAATVPHLGAKLASAFGAALGTPLEQRKQLIAAALDKRFSLEVQMEAYRQLWCRIGEGIAAAERRNGGRPRAATSDPDTFFAQSWLKRNLTLQSMASASVCSVTLSSKTPAAAKSAVVAADAPPAVADARAGSASSKAKQQSYQQQMNQLSAKHTFGSYLVLLLQSLSLLPCLLLIGFMILQKVSRQTWSTCPLQPHEEEWLPVLNPLGLRVLWQLILSTAAAPVWTTVAFKKAPQDYVVLVSGTTLACLVVVLLSFMWQEAMNAALLLVSPFALAGLPLVSLGFMGCNHELSEVGYKFMAVSDAFKCFLLACCAALSFLSTSYIPFLVTTAAAAVLLAGVTTWVALPDSLPPGYLHMKLHFNWREQRVVLLSGPRCQYITLGIAVLDMAGLSLLGLLISSLTDISGMVAVNGVGFGASVVGIAAAALLLQSRCMQLHVHSATILLAVIPGAALLKGIVAWQLVPSMWQVLLGVACIEVAFGGARGPLNGLLAMMTLPSRESSAVWQLLVVLLSNSAMLGVVATVLGLRVDPQLMVKPLLVCLGVIEGLRAVLGCLLARIHPRENLCAL